MHCEYQRNADANESRAYFSKEDKCNHTASCIPFRSPLCPHALARYALATKAELTLKPCAANLIDFATMHSP